MSNLTCIKGTLKDIFLMEDSNVVYYTKDFIKNIKGFFSIT